MTVAIKNYERSVTVKNHVGLIKYCTICDNRETFIKNLVWYDEKKKDLMFNLQCDCCDHILMNIIQHNVNDSDKIFDKE